MGTHLHAMEDFIVDLADSECQVLRVDEEATLGGLNVKSGQ